MPRLLGIDYGTKRTGIAVTDPLQIIVNGLTTVASDDLFDFLSRYFVEEEVELIVVGDPMYPDGNPAQIAPLVKKMVAKLEKHFPDIPVVLHDERYTSEEAKKIILQSGVSKKRRRDKSLVDKISAVLILQDYIETTRTS